MRKIKNWLLASGLMGMILFLSGCVSTNADGTPNESGIMYRILVKPMGSMITYLVENFDWNYGWAVVALTIVVRLIIMPLGIHQAKKGIVQTEKMQALKPQIDAAQAKAKAASTREEQLAANMEMQQVYKENGMSMMGGIGCLPLLIQMPIFSALFFTVKYTPGISEADFFGINLGQRSLLLVAIAGVAYVAQAYISTIGLPEEQKKTMKSMLIVSPLMIVFMSLNSPAGVTLYWVVGGIFSCIQTFITNVVMKPRIREQVQEELRKNPPKQVITPRKDVTPKEKAKKADSNGSNKKKNGQGRNAGKQQRNRD